MMRRGEVRWYRFARPDMRRPVVLLTRDSALQFLGEVTVAPITSTIRDIPTEVVVGPEDGLQRRCAVNLDHVQTVARGRLGSLVTTLSPECLLQIQRSLEFALGLE